MFPFEGEKPGSASGLGGGVNWGTTSGSPSSPSWNVNSVASIWNNAPASSSGEAAGATFAPTSRPGGTPSAQSSATSFLNPSRNATGSTASGFIDDGKQRLGLGFGGATQSPAPSSLGSALGGLGGIGDFGQSQLPQSGRLSAALSANGGQGPQQGFAPSRSPAFGQSAGLQSLQNALGANDQQRRLQLLQQQQQQQLMQQQQHLQQQQQDQQFAASGAYGQQCLAATSMPEYRRTASPQPAGQWLGSAGGLQGGSANLTSLQQQQLQALQAQQAAAQMQQRARSPGFPSQLTKLQALQAQQRQQALLQQQAQQQLLLQRQAAASGGQGMNPLMQQQQLLKQQEILRQQAAQQQFLLQQQQAQAAQQQQAQQQQQLQAQTLYLLAQQQAASAAAAAAAQQAQRGGGVISHAAILAAAQQAATAAIQQATGRSLTPGAGNQAALNALAGAGMQGGLGGLQNVQNANALAAARQNAAATARGRITPTGGFGLGANPQRTSQGFGQLQVSMSRLQQAPGLAGRSNSGLVGESGAAAFIRRAQSSPSGIAPGYSMLNGNEGQLQQNLQQRGAAASRGKSGPLSLAQTLLDPECHGIDTSSMTMTQLQLLGVQELLGGGARGTSPPVGMVLPPRVLNLPHITEYAELGREEATRAVLVNLGARFAVRRISVDVAISAGLLGGLSASDINLLSRGHAEASGQMSNPASPAAGQQPLVGLGGPMSPSAAAGVVGRSASASLAESRASGAGPRGDLGITAQGSPGIVGALQHLDLAPRTSSAQPTATSLLAELEGVKAPPVSVAAALASVGSIQPDAAAEAADAAAEAAAAKEQAAVEDAEDAASERDAAWPDTDPTAFNAGNFGFFGAAAAGDVLDSGLEGEQESVSSEPGAKPAAAAASGATAVSEGSGGEQPSGGGSSAAVTSEAAPDAAPTAAAAALEAGAPASDAPQLLGSFGAAAAEPRPGSLFARLRNGQGADPAGQPAAAASLFGGGPAFAAAPAPRGSVSAGPSPRGNAGSTAFGRPPRAPVPGAAAGHRTTDDLELVGRPRSALSRPMTAAPGSLGAFDTAAPGAGRSATANPTMELMMGVSVGDAAAPQRPYSSMDSLPAGGLWAAPSPASAAAAIGSSLERPRSASSAAEEEVHRRLAHLGTGFF